MPKSKMTLKALLFAFILLPACAYGAKGKIFDDVPDLPDSAKTVRMAQERLKTFEEDVDLELLDDEDEEDDGEFVEDKIGEWSCI